MAGVGGFFYYILFIVIVGGGWMWVWVVEIEGEGKGWGRKCLFAGIQRPCDVPWCARTRRIYLRNRLCAREGKRPCCRDILGLYCRI